MVNQSTFAAGGTYSNLGTQQATVEVPKTDTYLSVDGKESRFLRVGDRLSRGEAMHFGLLPSDAPPPDPHAEAHRIAGLLTEAGYSVVKAEDVGVIEGVEFEEMALDGAAIAAALIDAGYGFATMPEPKTFSEQPPKDAPKPDAKAESVPENRDARNAPDGKPENKAEAGPKKKD